MSFPALYVHGRIKHTFKLSSSVKQNHWKVKEQGDFIEKMFFLSNPKENHSVKS